MVKKFDAYRCPFEEQLLTEESYDVAALVWHFPALLFAGTISRKINQQRYDLYDMFKQQ